MKIRGVLCVFFFVHKETYPIVTQIQIWAHVSFSEASTLQWMKPNFVLSSLLGHKNGIGSQKQTYLFAFKTEQFCFCTPVYPLENFEKYNFVNRPIVAG